MVGCIVWICKDNKQPRHTGNIPNTCRRCRQTMLMFQSRKEKLNLTVWAIVCRCFGYLFLSCTLVCLPRDTGEVFASVWGCFASASVVVIWKWCDLLRLLSRLLRTRQNKSWLNFTLAGCWSIAAKLYKICAFRMKQHLFLKAQHKAPFQLILASYSWHWKKWRKCTFFTR